MWEQTDWKFDATTGMNPLSGHTVRLFSTKVDGVLIMEVADGTDKPTETVYLSPRMVEELNVMLKTFLDGPTSETVQA